MRTAYGNRARSTNIAYHEELVVQWKWESKIKQVAYIVGISAKNKSKAKAKAKAKEIIVFAVQRFQEV
jgi:hypothetical protein